MKHRLRFILAIVAVAAAVLYGKSAHAIPTVYTDEATSVTGTTAIIEGTVNPNGIPTTAWFQYSTTPDFSDDDPPRDGEGSVGSGTNPVLLTFQITLPQDTPQGTTFYYRLGAAQNDVPVYGSVVTFRTPGGVETPSQNNNNNNNNNQTQQQPNQQNEPNNNQTQLPPGPVIQNTGAIVTCKGDNQECGYRELIQLIQRIINFLLFTLSLPIAAAMFAYAGFLLMLHGGEEASRKKAKGIFWNVLKGLVIAMAAWLIINTIITTLIDKKLQGEGGYNLLIDSGKSQTSNSGGNTSTSTFSTSGSNGQSAAQTSTNYQGDQTPYSSSSNNAYSGSGNSYNGASGTTFVVPGYNGSGAYTGQ